MTTDEPIAELLTQRKLECELKLNRTESIYMPGKYKHFAFLFWAHFICLYPMHVNLWYEWLNNISIWICEEPLQSF